MDILCLKCHNIWCSCIWIFLLFSGKKMMMKINWCHFTLLAAKVLKFSIFIWFAFFIILTLRIFVSSFFTSSRNWSYVNFVCKDDQVKEQIILYRYLNFHCAFICFIHHASLIHWWTQCLPTAFSTSPQWEM